MIHAATAKKRTNARIVEDKERSAFFAKCTRDFFLKNKIAILKEINDHIEATTKISLAFHTEIRILDLVNNEYILDKVHIRIPDVCVATDFVRAWLKPFGYSVTLKKDYISISWGD